MSSVLSGSVGGKRPELVIFPDLWGYRTLTSTVHKIVCATEITRIPSLHVGVYILDV